MYESQDKMVSHPSHYQSASGLEVITVIEAFTEGLDGTEAYDTGNILKYMCRWNQKNGLQDLEKAAWYLQHLIDHVRGHSKSDAVPHKIMPEFPAPWFYVKKDAVFFIEAMQTLLKDRGKVTVNDACELMGISKYGYGDEYGWTNLDKVCWSQGIIDGNYTVVLPEVEKIVKGEEQ